MTEKNLNHKSITRNTEIKRMNKAYNEKDFEEKKYNEELEDNIIGAVAQKRAEEDNILVVKEKKEKQDNILQGRRYGAINASNAASII